jgi:hypothetical protein
MPCPDRLEDPPNITTLESIQKLEFTRNFDSARFTPSPRRQRAGPETQIEHHPVCMILQRSLIADKVGVVVAGDLFEQD